MLQKHRESHTLRYNWLADRAARRGNPELRRAEPFSQPPWCVVDGCWGKGAAPVTVLDALFACHWRLAPRTNTPARWDELEAHMLAAGGSAHAGRVSATGQRTLEVQMPVVGHLVCGGERSGGPDPAADARARTARLRRHWVRWEDGDDYYNPHIVPYVRLDSGDLAPLEPPSHPYRLRGGTRLVPLRTQAQPPPQHEADWPRPLSFVAPTRVLRVGFRARTDAFDRPLSEPRCLQVCDRRSVQFWASFEVRVLEAPGGAWRTHTQWRPSYSLETSFEAIWEPPALPEALWGLQLVAQDGFTARRGCHLRYWTDEPERGSAQQAPETVAYRLMYPAPARVPQFQSRASRWREPEQVRKAKAPGHKLYDVADLWPGSESERESEHECDSDTKREVVRNTGVE